MNRLSCLEFQKVLFLLGKNAGANLTDVGPLRDVEIIRFLVDFQICDITDYSLLERGTKLLYELNGNIQDVVYQGLLEEVRFGSRYKDFFDTYLRDDYLILSIAEYKREREKISIFQLIGICSVVEPSPCSQKKFRMICPARDTAHIATRAPYQPLRDDAAAPPTSITTVINVYRDLNGQINAGTTTNPTLKAKEEATSQSKTFLGRLWSWLVMGVWLLSHKTITVILVLLLAISGIITWNLAINLLRLLTQEEDMIFVYISGPHF